MERGGLRPGRTPSFVPHLLEPRGDRVEIEALRGEFTDAAMMRDRARLSLLFAPDGALRMPNIPDVMMTGTLTAHGKSVSFDLPVTHHRDETQPVSGHRRGQDRPEQVGAHGEAKVGVSVINQVTRPPSSPGPNSSSEDT
jgi:hypothetical protein